jgi:hypothetical protein
MMLIEMVLTDKQNALLHTKKKGIPRVNVTQLENTLHSIDEACKKKMVGLEGKKVGKTKATMTGLGAHYIAWKRKQKLKQQTNKLTSFMSRIVEVVSPSKRKKWHSTLASRTIYMHM